MLGPATVRLRLKDLCTVGLAIDTPVQCTLLRITENRIKNFLLFFTSLSLEVLLQYFDLNQNQETRFNLKPRA